MIIILSIIKETNRIHQLFAYVLAITFFNCQNQRSKICQFYFLIKPGQNTSAINGLYFYIGYSYLNKCVFSIISLTAGFQITCKE